MKFAILTSAAFMALAIPAQAGDRVIVGDTMVTGSSGSVLLFDGITPKHGFLVAIATVGEPFCSISDHGPAVIDRGFFVGSNAGNVSSPVFFAVPMFVTPPGYTPVGPVSIICNSDAFLTARAW
jgi:hypothetical protein